MAEGEVTTFTALTERFNLPPGNYKKPKLLYCSNGGHFLRILPDGTVDGTRDKSDQHSKHHVSVAPGLSGVFLSKGGEKGCYLGTGTLFSRVLFRHDTHGQDNINVERV